MALISKIGQLIIILCLLNVYLMYKSIFSNQNTHETGQKNDEFNMTITWDIVEEFEKIKNLFEPGCLDANLRMCPDEGTHLKVFIAVTSHPENIIRRTTIRRTWGHFALRSDVSIGFLLGSTLNSSLDADLEEEQETYEDLIRFRFVDSYENLTFKTVSMLNWTSNFCRKAKFLLKTDDDVFINVDQLMRLIDIIYDEQNAMFGKIVKGEKPFRDELSKYYLSPKQYQHEYLPEFLSGPAYLIPVNLTESLYLNALNHSAFRLEDVFISGIIAKKLNVKIIHVPSFYNLHLNIHTCNAKFLISIHNYNISEQYEIWRRINVPKSKCYWVKIL